jgi:inosine/xanthosine triphosphate pyrophosphatase family protein
VRVVCFPACFLTHTHTHTTFFILYDNTEVNTEAIAKEKALLGAQLAGGACVVEDTSLELEALGTCLLYYRVCR